jgi:acetyl-CoA acetyltransferase
MKKTLPLVLALVLAFPLAANAAELNKGTKSYQTAKKENTEQTAQSSQPATAEEAAGVAPAAGGDVSAPEKEKSFKEEIRLPRKN